MSDNDWKSRLGMVYSTDPNYKYEDAGSPETATLPPEKQQLKVWLESKHRGGKTVTLITGFSGTEDALAALGKHVGQNRF